MTSAVAYPPGPSTGGNFASEILYLKMMVISTTDLQLTCTYESGSGVFVPSGGGLIRDQDLDGYIQNLHNGTAGPLGPIYGAGTLVAPDVQVQRDCYIVIELVYPANLTLQPGVGAITIVEYAKYRSLYHYDANLTRHAGTSPPSAANLPCSIVCLGLSNFNDGDTDSFNLLIHLAQNTGNAIDAKIDPRIKNRG